MWKRHLFSFNLDEVSSFLKQAPWKHTESSGTLSGGPMVLTLMSKYKLNGGLVFSKKCKADLRGLYVIQKG